MKKYILILLCLLILPTVFAYSEGNLNQPNTLYAEIFNGTVYFNATNADITIYDENNTILILTKSMTKSVHIDGLFIYIFTPNTTGLHYYKTEFYKNGSFVLERGDSVLIKEGAENMKNEILFLALLFLIYLYLHKHVSTRSAYYAGFWTFIISLAYMYTAHNPIMAWVGVFFGIFIILNANSWTKNIMEQ